MAEHLNIHNALEEVGTALLKALSYQRYEPEKTDKAIEYVETILSNPDYLEQCETYFKTTGNYVLFYISNIVYNLKTKNELQLTPDVLKWLCSVWKNFLLRHKSYQSAFEQVDEYRIRFKKYFPGSGFFIQQIENVNQVKEEYLSMTNQDQAGLIKLQNFYQKISEIINWMRPTYFFLLDFYYERKIKDGVDYPEGIELEKGGMANFGQSRYTYGDLIIMTTQCLAILEAIYLILKKKKTSRQIINIDGKQKFLSIPEIYLIYLDKFNNIKKELQSLRVSDEE